MVARQLISAAIGKLNPTDTGAFALGLMDELNVSQLPVVNDTEYLGLISDADIYTLNILEEPVNSQKFLLNFIYVKENQHIYEVMKLFSSLHLSLLPVVDDKNQYTGCISLANLVQQFAEITAIENPGGIIVLEINDKDYLLTEIVQIIESNDAKVLSMYITSHPDSTKLEVTLKINKIDVGPILQTFNRYDYIISASFTEDTYTENLQDRYDSLMNYLNI
jgi:predicted transcriptional regulator